MPCATSRRAHRYEGIELLRPRAYLKVACALVSVVGLWPAGADAAFPGRNGRIAYPASSLEEENPPYRYERSITDENPGRGNPRVLRGCKEVADDTTRRSGDCSISYSDPAYSPDGARIAFDAGGRLAVMDADGRHFVLLPQQTASDQEPAWSPDGRRLIFTGHRSTDYRAPPDLYVTDVRGHGLRRLTTRRGSAPAWSTRNLIAFERRDNLYVMRPDGTGLRRLTSRGGFTPDWSPGGTRLVYGRGDGRLFLLRLEHRGARRIGSSHDASDPVFSPDGLRIAFYEGSDITIMDRRGRNVSSVGDGAIEGGPNSFYIGAPTWRPLR